MAILRRSGIHNATIASGAAVSDYIDFRSWAGAIIQMPGTWTAASIGFQVSNTSGGTYYPLYDDAGDLVQIASPAASKAYAIPAEVFGAAFVKIWSQDGSASNTNQAAERSLVVTLKG
jgi:hypothetical protein